MLLTLLLGSLAQAGPPSSAQPQAPTGIRVAMRGIIENWHDPYIASRFRSGGLSAGVGLVIPAWGPLNVDIEVTYQRVPAASGEGTMQMMPVSILAEYTMTPRGNGDLELFIGAGPAVMMWTEGGQNTDHTTALLPSDVEGGPQVGAEVLRGARPGLEARLGGRIDLGLVQESLRGVPQRSVRAVELEIYGARRFTSHSAGFNLNTWRGGIGLALRF